MKHKMLALVAFLGLMAALPKAHASVLGADADSSDSPTVLFSQSTLVMGALSNVTTFNVPSAGELFLTLSDLNYTSPFASLTFYTTNDLSAEVGQAQAGTLQLDLTGPTTLYAEVFATAQGSKDAGMYNLTATFLDDPSSPVPLPASGGLLAASILLWLGIGAVRKAGGLSRIGECLTGRRSSLGLA